MVGLVVVVAAIVAFVLGFIAGAAWAIWKTLT